MLLQPEQLEIIEAGLNHPGLLSRFESEFLLRLDRCRHRFCYRDRHLTPREERILIEIGSKPELQRVLAKPSRDRAGRISKLREVLV